MAAKKRAKSGSSKRRRSGATAVTIRGSALDLATGAVGYLGHYAVASRIPAIATNWWAAPLAMGVVGHMLKRRRGRIGNVGIATIGAAGYAFALGLQTSRAAARATPPPSDAGALVNADTGALVDDYASGVAGYLDDAQNPTSSFFAGEPGEADDAAVESAMNL